MNNNLADVVGNIILEQLMRKVSILSLLSLFLFISTANATLTKNGDVISDSNTNLNWLALTSTVGYTYNQMLGNFQDVNSTFYGYEYASLSQITTLFNSEGYSGDFYNFVYDQTSRDSATKVYDLFGKTGSNAYSRGDGMFLNEDGGSIDWLYYIPDSGNAALVRVLNNRINADTVYWDGSNGNQMGSWIVKSSVQGVPESASIYLLTLGLLGLFGALRRKV